MKTLTASRQNAVASAADRICEIVSQKPDAVLALSVGRTMAPLFDELARRYGEGCLSLRACRVFSVTEFADVPEEQSCRRMLQAELVDRTDLQGENCVWLSEESLDEYDERIRAAGGLNLAVLGLGVNAHIGYNEPVAVFGSLTHRQKLTEATRKQLEEQFGTAEAVPQYALTMGVKTLASAGEILLLAFGEEKAQAVFKTLYARNDGLVPSAFLQVPARVTVYLDEAAAAQL
ncbi:MAG: glucosamine-6-phosphate deaminase [Oscillospiraceae bacterium]|nr:glucosamine-6-phosphate deaminase [Oscillospiraceae bacterium]